MPDLQPLLETPGVIVAISGAVGIVTGAVLTHVLSPRIQARIEAEKERRAYRRQLVADWRAMLEDVARVRRDTGDDARVRRHLQGHKAFHSLEPRISDQARDAVYGARVVVPVSSDVLVEVQVLRTEIARIERQWDLV